MRIYHCHHCGEPLPGLSKALAARQDLEDADRTRRERHAAYKRNRYHSDPEYRERHLRRVARYRERLSGDSTNSPAPARRADAA